MSDEKLRALWRLVVASGGTDVSVIENYLVAFRRTQGAVEGGELRMGDPYVAALAGAKEWDRGGGLTLTLNPLDLDGRPIPKLTPTGKPRRSASGSTKNIEVKTWLPLDGDVFVSLTKAIFPECDKFGVDAGFDLDDLMHRLVKVVFERKTIANKFRRGTDEVISVSDMEPLGREEMEIWRGKRTALGLPLSTNLREHGTS